MSTHSSPISPSPSASGSSDVLTPIAPPPALPLPSRLFVPLPAGAEALALPPGTRVAAGEPLLSSTSGAAHVPLSPVAAVVQRVVSKVQLLGSGTSPAIEIEVAAAGAVSAARPAATSYTPTASLPTLIERIRGAGVRANRATCPDLLAQLHEAVRRPVDTVMCSLLDESGGSALSAVVMRTAGKEMLAGIEALATASGANRIWLIADSGIVNRASSLVRKAAAAGNGAARIKVIELANDYPQADPTLLLYALLGRRLRPGRLPPEVNALLLDGAAASAVGRAATRGEPMLEVPIEVRESARSRSTVYTAAVGLPVRHLLDACGLRPGDLTLRAGAALRDVRVTCDAIIDGGGELTVDAGPLSPPINPDPCIRCGWCVEACPVRIHPAGLLEAAQDSDLASAEQYGLHACIECGICSYVCPSRLPLLPAIRELRKKKS